MDKFRNPATVKPCPAKGSTASTGFCDKSTSRDTASCENVLA